MSGGGVEKRKEESPAQVTSEADTVMDEQMTSDRGVTVTKPQSCVTVLR